MAEIIIPPGIRGLRTREPIGAVLTVGVKGPTGAPIEKDRFHIVLPDAASEGRGDRETLVRAPHPGFAAFNNGAHVSLLREVRGPDGQVDAEKTRANHQRHAAELGRRQIIRATLVHRTVAECFHDNRRAQQLPGMPQHPRKAPACIGNGEIAKRWIKGEYVQIPCPGEQCEYAKKGWDERKNKETKAPCGPNMRFLARFRWDANAAGVKLPEIVFKFNSGGWNSTGNFAGFFETFRNTALNLGLDPDQIPLFGLPVYLQLGEKTNTEVKSRFPLAKIDVDGADVMEWIQFQHRRLGALKALDWTRVPALTDREQNTPEVLAADYETISPGRRISVGAPPEE